MEIILRNGEKILLDWNPIVLEYLEEYENGIEQLIEDVQTEECRFKTFNFIVYCILSAVYPRELGYREAVSLVSINDLEDIAEFVMENLSSMKGTTQETTDFTKKIKRIHRR